MTEKKTSGDLLAFLNCEALDKNLFRGQSKDFKTGQVFGGQVLGQAIKAAYETVGSERLIHSAHAYFLKRGDVDAPIIYEVDRSLDGGSFSSRRVVAIQHGQQIFHLSASFQKKEAGLEHHRTWVPPIDVLNSALEAKASGKHSFQSEFFDVHHVPDDQVSEPETMQYWFKAKQSLPDDIRCHHAILAYISDMGLLLSTLAPHELDEPNTQQRYKKVIMASLDHAIWFHRSFNVEDWLFYECRAQSTGNGRGLAFGRVYDQQGMLVASTSQEGLIRLKDKLDLV